MAMLDAIGAKLQAMGVGTEGTDIFEGEMPDLPHNCIGLFEYAGSPSILAHDGAEIERPGLQVRVRNTDYATGRAKIESIVVILNAITNTTLSGTRYHAVRANQSPHCLGRDLGRRWEWVVNFSVRKNR